MFQIINKSIKTLCDPREEIEILLRYGKHPGIVTLKNVYEDSRKYYLVLQLLRGGDLLNYMMKRVSDRIQRDILCQTK